MTASLPLLNLSSACGVWPVHQHLAQDHLFSIHSIQILSGVKRIGKPVLCQSEDIDLSKVVKALKTFAAIVDNSPRRKEPTLPDRLQRVWKSSTAPWIEHFLRLVLEDSHHHVYTCPRGGIVDVHEEILQIIPPLLTLHAPTSYNLTFIKRDSPNIVHLITQVFTKTLDIARPTWSGLATHLMVLYHLMPFGVDLLDPYAIHPTMPTPYPNDDALGLLFIRHLNTLAPMVKGPLTTETISKIGIFIGLITPKTFHFIPGDDSDANPLMRPSVLNYTLKAITDFTIAFLLHHKPTPPLNVNLDPSTIHEIVRFSLRMLLGLSDDMVRIGWIIESGVLEAIFKAPVEYFQHASVIAANEI